MADDVIITGLNGVPAWATEDTLTKIHEVLKKTLGIQKSAATPGSGTKTLDDSLGDISKAISGYNKKLRESNDLSERDLVYKRRAEALHEKVGSAQALLATTLAASVKVFDAMKASMINNVQTFDRMNSAGIMAAGTINGQDDVFKNLGNMAMLASLRAEKLADVLTKYTGANAVGAVKFAKALNTAQPGLMKLGFNSAAAAEVMGAYLETVAGTRDIQSLSGAEIAAGTEQFAKNMTRISLALGVSREKLMQYTATINSSIEANAVAADYGDAAAQKMSMFLASFKDANVAEAVKKMMSAKMPVLDSTFQAFAKAGLGGLGLKLANFYKSLVGLDPIEAQRRNREFMKSLGDLDPIISQQKFLAEAGNEAAAQNLATLIGLRQQQALDNQMGDEAYEQQQRAAAASAKIATQWEGIKASLQKIFAPSATLLEFLGTGLEYLAVAVKAAADQLGEFDKWVEQIFSNQGLVFKDATASIITLVVAIGGLISAIKTFKYLLQTIKAAGAVKDAIVGGKAAGSVAGTVAGGAGGMGKAGAGLGGILGGLGKGVGELLKGIGAGGGALIESILTGIANGVSAFNNPLFVGGAAKLSVGIGLLSIGFGAASFILGKTLPILSEGLRSFSDIDGSNLIDVGLGLMGLSSGLALFGIGSVAAAGGSAISGIMETIGGLFGTKSPLEKIKDFASIGPDLSLAGSGMTALAAGLTSFASVDNAALKANVDAVNKLRAPSGITSWFKTPPSGSIARGEATDTDTASVTRKTRVSEAKVEEKTPTTTKATGSGFEQPASDSGLNTLLAQQVSLTSMVLAKLDSSLSVSKDILKYTKLQT